MDKLEERERPEEGPVSSVTIRRSCGCGSLYTVISYDESGALEVFAYLGKAGSCQMAVLEGLTRCITKGLKLGVPLSSYSKQLSEIRCEKSKPFPKGQRAFSCLDSLSRAFTNFEETLWPSLGEILREEPE